MNTFLANNLKAIWDIDKRRIHFVFLVTNGSLTADFLKHLGELSEALMQNLELVPPLSEADIEYSIKRQESILKFTFSGEGKEAIKKIGQGHPYIIKLACLLLAPSKQKDPYRFLASRYQVEYLKNLIQKEQKGITISQEGQLLVDNQAD